MMNNIVLAILPINQSQFVFIQFLHSLILSWPQARFDYYIQIEKKMSNLGKVIYENDYDEHLYIIRKGLDQRSDIFKGLFLIA